MTLQVDIDGAELARISLVELVFNDSRVDPPISHRLGITLTPEGIWTAEGNMPLDHAARMFFDHVADEANKQGLRFVRDVATP